MGLTFVVDSDRGDHRHDAVVEEELQVRHIDSGNLSHETEIVLAKWLAGVVMFCVLLVPFAVYLPFLYYQARFSFDVGPVVALYDRYWTELKAR